MKVYANLRSEFWRNIQKTKNYSASLYAKLTRRAVIMLEHPCRQVLASTSCHINTNQSQWDDSPNGGFSTTTPWQLVNASYKSINAASQISNPNSVFTYWSTLLSLRKKHLDLLVYGDYTLVDDGNEDVFAYYRSYREQRLLVVTNWRKEEKTFTVPEGLKLKAGERMIGNYEEEKLEGKKELRLRPYEAWAWFVEKA